MSGYFDNNASKYLSGTISSAVDRTKYQVLSAHYYMDVSQGSENTILALRAGASNYAIGLATRITPDLKAFETVDLWSSSQGRAGNTTLATTTWYHTAAWFEPDDTSKLARPFIDGTADNTASLNLNFSANAADFDVVRIGLRHDGGSPARGYIAEVSLWECDLEATAASLIGELATKIPSSVTVSGATMRGYWPLEANANFDTAGVNLTNNGSVTFTAGTHPSLSGGGGGGMTRPLILPWRHVG